ncbi:uncharacterized protein STEHIDRAFT_161580 [Stereum hirsutum FP-91666 SS1]|uniref:uncharacterized protein n=1 Tax=Stereum hirsutum (strain FP-91666) TaxID=721885 RepID=UPI000444A85D|nr:uncharacterized protein STEHIDRAFT_161580 [Stereum hirsutum FP-91666 SS1]EIM81387.1 hypothetical protein STEHIDRAFT_161580 [Stereum hirsutum FP-91666 SS1]
MEVGLLPVISFGAKEMDDAPLATHEIHAYHSVIQQTHEDDIVDQAAAVLLPIIRQREWKAFISPEELSSLCYMLSDEASIRTNITTAQYLVYLEQSASLDLTGEQCAVLLSLLVKSSQRYSFSLTGEWCDTALWKCPFIYALLAVVRPIVGGYSWYDFDDIPIVILLLYGPSVDTYGKVVSQGLPSDWNSTVIPFLLKVIRAKLEGSDSSSPRPGIFYWDRWTPESHREGIKRSVLELFRTFSPEARVTTVDTNDTPSDMAIPWEWLENSHDFASGLEAKDGGEH